MKLVQNTWANHWIHDGSVVIPGIYAVTSKWLAGPRRSTWPGLMRTNPATVRAATACRTLAVPLGFWRVMGVQDPDRSIIAWQKS